MVTVPALELLSDFISVLFVLTIVPTVHALALR